MASVDSYNNLFGVVCIPPAEYTRTQTGATVDMLGYESVTFFITTGVVTDGTWGTALEDSDSSGSGFADVVAPYLLGEEPDFGIDDDQIYRVGYVGNKRYVRLNVLLSTPGTAIFGVFAVMGAPRVAPTPEQPVT